MFSFTHYVYFNKTGFCSVTKTLRYPPGLHVFTNVISLAKFLFLFIEMLVISPCTAQKALLPKSSDILPSQKWNCSFILPRLLGQVICSAQGTDSTVTQVHQNFTTRVVPLFGMSFSTTITQMLKELQMI